jgi:hypothetical protein
VGTTPKDKDQGDDQGCSAGIAARILTRYASIRGVPEFRNSTIFLCLLKLIEKFSSYRENSRTPFHHPCTLFYYLCVVAAFVCCCLAAHNFALRRVFSPRPLPRMILRSLRRATALPLPAPPASLPARRRRHVSPQVLGAAPRLAGLPAAQAHAQAPRQHPVVPARVGRPVQGGAAADGLPGLQGGHDTRPARRLAPGVQARQEGGGRGGHDHRVPAHGRRRPGASRGEARAPCSG